MIFSDSTDFHKNFKLGSTYPLIQGDPVLRIAFYFLGVKTTPIWKRRKNPTSTSYYSVYIVFEDTINPPFLFCFWKNNFFG